MSVISIFFCMNYLFIASAPYSPEMLVCFFFYLLLGHINYIVWIIFYIALRFFLSCWVLYIFWILTPYHIYDLQEFSPIPKSAFSFCWWFSLLCRSFSSWCSPTLFVCFCCLSFWCQIPQIITKTYVKVCMFFLGILWLRSYV